jgi:hypothetical protein
MLAHSGRCWLILVDAGTCWLILVDAGGYCSLLMDTILVSILLDTGGLDIGRY